MIPGRGVMYSIELVFILAFIVALIKTKYPPLILLGLLLLIAPIPAAFSKGLGHATNRSAVMIPVLAIITAVGLDYVGSMFKKHQKLFTAAVVMAYVVSLTFFLEDYVYHAPKINAPAMSYGWAELMPRLKGIAVEYDQVQISRSLSEPHIFVAFYLPIPPREFQKEIQKYSDFNANYKFFDQMSGVEFGKYWFGDIRPQDPVSKSTLFVGPPDQFPIDHPEYFHIDYPGGKTAIKVAHGI